MIKIIKDGQKKFVVKCHACECEFSYEIDDVSLGLVVCPCCGHYVKHMTGVYSPINYRIGHDGITTADWTAPDVTITASTPKRSVTKTTNWLTKDYSEEELNALKEQAMKEYEGARV